MLAVPAGQLAGVAEAVRRARTSKPPCLGEFEATGRLRLFYQRATGRRPGDGVPARGPAGGRAAGRLSPPCSMPAPTPQVGDVGFQRHS